jgi:hypothetical protein
VDVTQGVYRAGGLIPSRRCERHVHGLCSAYRFLTRTLPTVTVPTRLGGTSAVYSIAKRYLKRYLHRIKKNEDSDWTPQWHTQMART